MSSTATFKAILARQIAEFSRRAAAVRIRHPDCPEFALADEGAAHGITCVALEMGLMTITEVQDAASDGVRAAAAATHSTHFDVTYAPSGGHP